MLSTAQSKSFVSLSRQFVPVQGGDTLFSYCRKMVDQTGSGHFSPIGAYNPKTDMVLVLDVARFKYPPHWIPVPLMFKAMMQKDETTGVSRGFALLGHAEPAEALENALDAALQCKPVFTRDALPPGIA